MTISAMKMIFLERPSCEEFYEVYKGVVPEYIVRAIHKNKLDKIDLTNTNICLIRLCIANGIGAIRRTLRGAGGEN